MSKKHCSKYTLKRLEEALKNVDTLYNANCINWSGETNDTNNNRPYVEVISEVLLQKKESLLNVNSSQRESFYVDTHDGKINAFTNRSEEMLAKSLYCQEIDGLGTIFDYQVPLKSKQKDKAGKIDLVSISNDSNTIYLIELKVADSTETLLRCGLEIHTYYKQLEQHNFENFKNDLKNKYLSHFNDNQNLSNKLKEFNGEFKKAILIFAGSTPANMTDRNVYPNTMTLIDELGIKIFIYPKEIEYTIQAQLRNPVIL